MTGDKLQGPPGNWEAGGAGGWSVRYGLARVALVSTFPSFPARPTRPNLGKYLTASLTWSTSE